MKLPPTAGPIPQKHVEFCKAVAALAGEHGVQSCSLSFRPAFGDEWRDPITMTWERGRHGQAAHGCVVTSSVQIRAEIDG